MKVICEVFRSPKKEGMYLYVNKPEGFDRVPDALLELFGQPQSVMTMLLSPGKKLAKADSDVILANFEEKGFYLQMPPEPEAYMSAIAEHNSKLPR
jgi:hypothetical protein